MSIFNKFSSLIFNSLSIDLGTTSTLIYSQEQGVVLNEPSIIVLEQLYNTNKSSQLLAIGESAKTMIGRTPKNVIAIRPLRDGVISDFQATETMLQHFINKVQKKRLFKSSPKVVICVPCLATQVERRAIKESALKSGAKQVYLIEKSVAAALGAGLMINKARGTMVVDIGGGTTEIAVLSLNGLVYSSSKRIGGDKLDDSIIQFIKREYGILIGEITAERIKQEIGCALPKDKTKKLAIMGRNISEGTPQKIVLNSNDIYQALHETIALIVDTILSALEQIPPELSSDIVSDGITLTGGGALLNDLDKLISLQTGLQVNIAHDPLSCVVRGGGVALLEPEVLNISMYDDL